MAVSSIIVKVDLGVKADNLAFGSFAKGVDLNLGGVDGNEQIVKLLDLLRCSDDLLTLEVQVLCHFDGLNEIDFKVYFK